MKRHINRILFGAFTVLFLCVAGMIWWQWDNLRALKQAMDYSSQELEQQMQENQQLIQDAVNAAPEIVVRDLTEEERQALREGLLSQEELIDRLINPQRPTQSETQSPAAVPDSSSSAQSGTEAQPPAPAGAAQSQQPVQPEQTVPPEEPPVPESDYQKKLSALIAEVYVLREKYTIELDNMYAAAKEEYKAKPKSQRTKDKLTKWAAGYVSRANKLEKACDASMDDIVARMETLIRENNGDLSLVDTVVYTYANEKSLKKAYYMAILEEKGLIQ